MHNHAASLEKENKGRYICKSEREGEVERDRKEGKKQRKKQKLGSFLDLKKRDVRFLMNAISVMEETNQTHSQLKHMMFFSTMQTIGTYMLTRV